jgi:hypothetical protein
MIQFKKLAIAGAVSALLLGATTAEASVTYNLNPSTANSNSTGPWSDGTIVKPAGYIGKMPVTWVADIQNDINPNETDTVSKANAIAQGAVSTYAVESLSNRWNPSRSWGNALDFGLITLHSAGDLLIQIAADATQSSTFKPGFTLFSGWDTSATSSKHGSWNVALPAIPVNPRGTTGLTYLGQASSTVAGDTVSYLFSNLAAGNYSLWIGGNGSDASPVGSQSYIANITASPSAVPVPGAVWLFGSAIAGFAGLRRRKLAA